MPLEKYLNNEGVDEMDYEKRFLTACACFKSCLYEELRFLSLGDGLRSEIIPTLHKLVRLLKSIFVLGEQMARTCPDCRTVRNRPTDHFLAQFERAIVDLEANQLLPEPKASVDFYVSSDLDDCRADTSALLSSKKLPPHMTEDTPFHGISHP
ncbi:unnamed protein product [Penicillium palitans]